MIKRRFTSIVASVALVTASSTAIASPSVCESFESSYGLACPFNGAGQQQSLMIQQSSIITLIVLSTMLNQRFSLLTSPSSELGGPNRFALGAPGQTGMAAQAGGSRWNAWFGYAHSDQAQKFVPAASDGHSNVFLGGVDYTFRNNAVFGLALSFDQTKMTTAFNGGNFTSDGWSLSPYFAYPFSRSLLFDASLGVGSADLRVNNSIPFVIPQASSIDDRWFGSVSLSHVSNFKSVLLTLKGSLLHSEDKTKAFFAAAPFGQIGQPDTSRLTQLRLGGQLAFDAGSGFQPYVGLTYINDLQREALPITGGLVPANDRDAWNIAAGLNYFSKGPVSAGIQFSSDTDRRETRNNQFMANIAIRF